MRHLLTALALTVLLPAAATAQQLPTIAVQNCGDLPINAQAVAAINTTVAAGAQKTIQSKQTGQIECGASACHLTIAYYTSGGPRSGGVFTLSDMSGVCTRGVEDSNTGTLLPLGQCGC